MEKYFVPFNFDQMWSILAVLIRTRLPMDFALVVCTLVICFFNSPKSITNPLVSARGAPILLILGTTMMGWHMDS